MEMSRSDTVGRGELLARFDAVGLDELDAKASLQRRVDNKYLVSWAQLADLFDALRGDHQVLEIDDRRWFSYESTYFDTASLRCFRDHVEDRAPRFKLRTRLYADSGKCNFEVKVKRDGDETDKQQIEIDAEGRDRIDPEIARFLDRALREVPDPPAPDDFAPTLITSFRRCTLAAANESERVTCDDSLELRSRGGAIARLRDALVVVETKTEDGRGRCDRLLAEAGVEPVSFSKYRVGVGLLIAEDPDPPLADRLHDVFRSTTRASGS
jgi:VTC domain